MTISSNKKGKVRMSDLTVQKQETSVEPTNGTTLPTEVETVVRIVNSELMPKRFRGKMQVGIELINMAQRTGIDIYELARSLYEVHGELALDAKFAVAQLKMSGKIKGPIRYEFNEPDKVDNLTCTVTVRDAELDEDITWTYRYMTAKLMKLTEKSAHWKGDPRNMMAKRAATQFIRNTYPEVLFGLFTRDEIQDQHDLAQPDDESEQISEFMQRGRLTFDGVDHPPKSMDQALDLLDVELQQAMTELEVDALTTKYGDLYEDDGYLFCVAERCNERSATLKAIEVNG